jgi:acylpyruvate hydrolase
MKIFCIGRNYADHAKELKNDLPTEPLVFMKPPTALLRENKPFFLPDFTKDCHYEGEIVLRIAKNGKAIDPKFAHKYIDAIAFGIDWTARDVQDKLKSKGHPWEIAKGFDSSATISEFIPIGDFDLKNLKFQLKKNGEVVQNGNTADLIFDFETVICYVSQFFTLVKGDYIYTGTPAGVGPAKIGDRFEGFIEGKLMLVCAVK